MSSAALQAHLTAARRYATRTNRLMQGSPRLSYRPFAPEGRKRDAWTDTVDSSAQALSDLGCEVDLSVLRDLVVIFALSIGILLLSHRLRLPAIIGLLLTG